MATDWAGLIGNGLSAWSAWNQNQTAGDLANAAKGYSENLMNNQNFYNEQLKGLVTDPSKFLDNPLYKAAFDQGTQAVTRGAAASGFLGSGNMAASLQQYGQSMASNYLLQQEQLLGGLAGLNGNPISGLNTAANINASSGNFLGSLVGELGRYYGKDITNWAKGLFGDGTAAGGSSSIAGPTLGSTTGAGAATGVGSANTAAGSGAGYSDASTTVGSQFGSSATEAGLGAGGAGGAISSIAGPSLGTAYGLGSGAAGTAAGVAGTEGASSVAGPTLESLFGSSAAEAGLGGTSATSAGSTATQAGSSGAGVMPYVGALAAAYTVGSGIAGDIFGSHNVSATPKAGQTEFILPEGMPSLRQGNLAIGLGNDSSKGSGNVYQVLPDGTTKKIDDNNRGSLISMYTAARLNGPDGVVHLPGNKSWSTPVSQVLPGYTAKMQKLYDSTGGKDAWGVSASEWMDQMVNLRSSVSGMPNTGW